MIYFQFWFLEESLGGQAVYFFGVARHELSVF
jgi:hypothetical protein